ncbi:MAG TPA: PD-(D/E)XK nuclease family protein [Steroidobacteraceae bacterium]|nr:PD-(D/E)XK nuclease family protein [Steroidobacteraceae bacterium]
MLEVTHELLEHLKSGGTLVVPSRQRAAAIRVAYGAGMLATGLTIWNTPDVLPWSAWIERELDAARARGEALPRRLSAAEEWLLWHEAVLEACSGLQLLMPATLIEPVRRAIGRLDDYGLSVRPAATVETGVLLQARAHFRRRCQELGVLGTTSWRDCAAHLQPSPRLLLAGFAALGPARRTWLEQHGARVAAQPAAEALSALGGIADADADSVRVLDCDNPLLEAEAAAQWCATQLTHDGRARLLLVVPRLAQQRHLWERTLSQRLDFASLLTTGTSRGESLFALEGGQALSAYPLVATALHLIALAVGQLPFERFSALLRGAYLAALDRHHCLQIDLWLREHNVGEVESGMLQRLLAPLSLDLGEAAVAPLQGLIAALEAEIAPGTASAAVWARSFAALLGRCGWPGQQALGSDEQQVRMRFDQLLGDFAAITVPAELLQGGGASRLLHDMAQRIAFEPASDDVPVTVTASLDDPILRYDGIWIAGLSAEVWPPAAQPDALLPQPLQREAGVPEASAEGQLRLAGERMRQWQRCAVHCVYSWSRTEAELPRDMSPLLRMPSAAQPATGADCAPAFELHRWLQAHSPPLEAWHDASGPAWPHEHALRGGIRLLELQSLCPFRSFAELRLQARKLPEPQPGIDPRLRGQMLHRALELFWRSMRDSTTLARRGRDAAQTLGHQCVRSAIEQVVARLPGSIGAALLRRERVRAERLMDQLIDWELSREPFATQALEADQLYAIAGAVLQLRLDRVDRLSDGRLVVIDYKSGAAERFDALAERPPQPQLPAYATAAGADVAAVMAVYLGREGLKLRGLADRPGRLPGRGIEAVPGGELAWTALLQQWRERLERLMREFLEGHAVVQPQLGACEYCHLQMLCRVDAQVLAAAAAAAAGDAQAALAAADIDSDVQ